MNRICFSKVKYVNLTDNTTLLSIHFSVKKKKSPFTLYHWHAKDQFLKGKQKPCIFQFPSFLHLVVLWGPLPSLQLTTSQVALGVNPLTWCFHKREPTNVRFTQCFLLNAL